MHAHIAWGGGVRGALAPNNLKIEHQNLNVIVQIVMLFKSYTAVYKRQKNTTSRTWDCHHHPNICVPIMSEFYSWE
jgi:hypothetical protein